MNKELNSEQRQAVDSDSNLIVCIAGAGSGKTTVLVDRIARLIADGADPRSFVVITYTNAAAAEIERRIYDDGSGEKVRAFLKLGYVGTLHGFMLRLLTKHHALVGLPSTISVFDDDQQTGFVEQIMAEMNVKAAKKNVLPLLKRADLIDGVRAMRTKEELVAMEYHARLRTSGLLDFDAILHYGEKLVKLLAKGAEITGEHAWPYEYLFVDEYQDSADADARIYEAMPCPNKFVVGDPDQCQPAGTKILLSEGNEIPIECVRPGFCVVSYDRHSKSLLKRMKVTSSASRSFVGNLWTISAGGKQTQCTPNHKWLIRWLSGSERRTTNWCTYLMRKGDSFRVGKTKFFRNCNGDAVIGLALRMKQEKADAAWVLKVHDTAEDALKYEQIVAATYGLPETCFVASFNHALRQASIDEIFARVPNQLAKAVRCLQAHGRELEYPMFDRSERQTRRTVQEVRACNLLPEVMHVPVVMDGYNYRERNGNWQPINVSFQPWSGVVFSLDVEKHHKYVADGIVTCNSIYGFRGGNVQNILNLANEPGVPSQVAKWQVLLLETNYRCGANIAHAAQRLVERNADRYPKKTRPFQGNGVVVAEAFAAPAAEMAFVVHELTRSRSGTTKNSAPAPIEELRETAVLARTNRIAGEFADHLRGLGVKVSERKLAETPADWRLAKLALTVLANPWNDMAVHRLLVETKGQAEADVARMHAAKIMRPLCEAAQIVTDALDHNIDAESFLSRTGLSAESRARVREAAGMLSARGEWSLNDLVAALASGEERAAVDGDGVTVATFHSSKGREWSTVYMVGCEEGVCPSGRKGTDVEEERRLFYVAMTRAKKRLVITRCEARPSPFGRRDMVPCEPSRFISEAVNNP